MTRVMSVTLSPRYLMRKIPLEASPVRVMVTEGTSAVAELAAFAIRQNAAITNNLSFIFWLVWFLIAFAANKGWYYPLDFKMNEFRTIAGRHQSALQSRAIRLN